MGGAERCYVITHGSIHLFSHNGQEYSALEALPQNATNDMYKALLQGREVLLPAAALEDEPQQPALAAPADPGALVPVDRHLVAVAGHPVFPQNATAEDMVRIRFDNGSLRSGELRAYVVCTHASHLLCRPQCQKYTQLNQHASRQKACAWLFIWHQLGSAFEKEHHRWAVPDEAAVVAAADRHFSHVLD